MEAVEVAKEEVVEESSMAIVLYGGFFFLPCFFLEFDDKQHPKRK